jgi:chloride channel 3/4/5
MAANERKLGVDIYEKSLSGGHSYESIPDEPLSSGTHDSARSTMSETSEVDEDFVTLDWALHEEEGYAEAQRRLQALESLPSVLRTLIKIYDAMQGWIALTLIGCATGLLAAIVAIGSEWASDLKFGHCYSDNGFAHQFWITRKLCCKHTVGDETCPLWRHWHDILGLAFGYSFDETAWAVNYACYVAVAILQAVIAARICVTLAPYAAGAPPLCAPTLPLPRSPRRDL